MIVSALKTEKRVDTWNDRAKHIQIFGENNDQPQRLVEVVDASVTGRACIDIYSKFIEGRGFADADFYKLVTDTKGTTTDMLLKAVADDYARFGGFAIHVNYDGNYNVCTASHVPFEWLRFEELDENYKFARLAMHPDWGRRYTKLRTFKPKDIVWFHFFNPLPEIVAREVEAAGGWNAYTGQILYYSNRGDKTYPIPIYDAAVTDMSNEEGLSNLTYRNVRHSFLPAGMLVDYDNMDVDEAQIEEKKAQLREFQGDENAGKIMYTNVRFGEQKPEFVPFSTRDIDKDFEQAENKTPDIIGSAFTQPPILRAKDVGAHFGADLMRNAYDFYNSITEGERMEIERQFKRIFSRWAWVANPSGDYSILPKVYRVNATLAERIGAEATKNVIELLKDGTVSEQTKRNIFSAIYGMEDEVIDRLINGIGV